LSRSAIYCDKTRRRGSLYVGHKARAVWWRSQPRLQLQSEALISSSILHSSRRRRYGAFSESQRSYLRLAADVDRLNLANRHVASFAKRVCFSRVATVLLVHAGTNPRVILEYTAILRSCGRPVGKGGALGAYAPPQ